MEMTMKSGWNSDSEIELEVPVRFNIPDVKSDNDNEGDDFILQVSSSDSESVSCTVTVPYIDNKIESELVSQVDTFEEQCSINFYNLTQEGDIVRDVLKTVVVEHESPTSESEEEINFKRKRQTISFSDSHESICKIEIKKNGGDVRLLKKYLKKINFNFNKYLYFWDRFKHNPNQILRQLKKIKNKTQDDKQIISQLILYQEFLELNTQEIISHSERTSRSKINSKNKRRMQDAMIRITQEKNSNK